MSGLKILGTGSYSPEIIATNHMFEQIVETSDEWITSRTGITNRRLVDQETNLQMMGHACQRAIDDAGIAACDIAVVICATVTSDYITPAMATLLQRDLGLSEEVLTFDINGACSGFVYALEVAHALLGKNEGKYAVVCAGEILSRITDYQDRTTCVLFGDGAGAVVIGRSDDNPYAFRAGAKGDDSFLYCKHPVATNQHPFARAASVAAEDYFVHMNGQEVFRFAVESISKSVSELKLELELSDDDIKYYILHQANYRIIDAVARKLKEPSAKFFINISEHGNTSAASIPIALDEANKQGLFQRGDKLIFAGFGGGLTYGSALITW